MKIISKNLVLCCAIIGCVLVSDSFAELSSENYIITTSEISGGGGRMESSSFSLDGTIGQPTPIMDATAPPSSTSYQLYPGFWYTLSCPGDTIPNDGDVDGVDLAAYANALLNLGTVMSLADFAGVFGHTTCP